MFTNKKHNNAFNDHSSIRTIIITAVQWAFTYFFSIMTELSHIQMTAVHWAITMFSDFTLKHLLDTFILEGGRERKGGRKGEFQRLLNNLHYNHNDDWVQCL